MIAAWLPSVMPGAAGGGPCLASSLLDSAERGSSMLRVAQHAFEGLVNTCVVVVQMSRGYGREAGGRSVGIAKAAYTNLLGSCEVWTNAQPFRPSSRYSATVDLLEWRPRRRKIISESKGDECQNKMLLLICRDTLSGPASHCPA